MIPVPLPFEEVARRDHLDACAHEAGHFVMLLRCGPVQCWASVWPDYDPDDPPSGAALYGKKLFAGQCSQYGVRLTVGQNRLVAIAGVVGAAMARDDYDNDWVAAEGLWKDMSLTDRKMFGRYNERAVLRAATEVNALLEGPLADDWSRVRQELMDCGETSWIAKG
jgi:hypothetical protein